MMKYVYYLRKKKFKKLLSFTNIILVAPRFAYEKDMFSNFEKIMIDSGICDFLMDIDNISTITILKFNYSELLFSIRLNELDNPSTIKQQIKYFEDLLPKNIKVFPYKNIKTVYKFSIMLNHYELILEEDAMERRKQKVDG